MYRSERPVLHCPAPVARSIRVGDLGVTEELLECGFWVSRGMDATKGRPSGPSALNAISGTARCRFLRTTM
jgi:hypothetical protein